MAIVKQNIAFAIGVKIVFLILGAAGFYYNVGCCICGCRGYPYRCNKFIACIACLSHLKIYYINKEAECDEKDFYFIFEPYGLFSGFCQKVL